MSLKLLRVRKSFPATEHPADTICRVSERSPATTPLTPCVCMMLMEKSLVLVPAATHTQKDTHFSTHGLICVWRLIKGGLLLREQRVRISAR